MAVTVSTEAEAARQAFRRPGSHEHQTHEQDHPARREQGGLARGRAV